jgi:hypothetical protein
MGGGERRSRPHPCAKPNPDGHVRHLGAVAGRVDAVGKAVLAVMAMRFRS